MNEQTLEKRASELKRKLAEYRQECVDKKEKETNALLEWQRAREDAIRELEVIVNNLKPKMLGKFKNILTKSKRDDRSAISASDINFDKLVYYIDCVNEMEVPENIIQRNPRYCETVLETIAGEYLKIKSYLNFEKDEKERLSKTRVSEFEKDLKNLARQDCDVFYTVEVEDLAKEEAEDTINRIRRSVM